MSEEKHIVVVGAGMGGLAAAVWARTKGLRVTVLEKAPRVGGKMRQVEVAGRCIDGGPTVITMPWVFEELFEEAGTSLAAEVKLEPLEVLARHFWPDGEQLDLFSDIDRSVDAISDFAGADEGAGYRRYIERGRRIYEHVGGPFIYSQKPSMRDVVRTMVEARFLRPWELDLHLSMWRALAAYFRDARLRQLFGRYATYYGSSPFKSPGILNLIAHVEQRGVWVVADGGMYRLAEAMERTLERLGGTVRCESHVDRVVVDAQVAAGVVLAGGEEIAADAVLLNADARALAAGLFGDAVRRALPPLAPRLRALSAVTFCLVADVPEFPLVRHNVFFSSDYPAEFRDIFEHGQVPAEPTVYVCAQDRDAQGRAPDGPEKLLVLVNAPPRGDVAPLTTREIEQCQDHTFAQLRRCGLDLDPAAVEQVVTTPADFDRLFPATGGALYGTVTHGMLASFRRPGARTKIKGLYVCGGAVHPGAGVPMTAISGKVAVEAICADLGSTSS